jgi:pseudouridine-5'-phosphate glycosidase
MTGRLRIGDEVARAIETGAAVVALETSVIGQGLPHPRNVECLERMSGAIRDAAAIPAWVGVVDGEVVVGLDDRELAWFAEPGRSEKVARRDLPAACARGGLGATTVSATIWAAARARIPVGATGGIGGVHLGNPSDVSADLVELSRTPGLLVCSGPKSIVDPVETIERLEALGVSVVGYRTDRLPGFLATATAVTLEHRVEDPSEAASLLRAAADLDASSTLLLCHAPPADLAIDPDELRDATLRAEERALGAGVRGRDVTPFLLERLAEETGGRSLDANLALLESNAGLAGEVARAASGRSG